MDINGSNGSYEFPVPQMWTDPTQDNLIGCYDKAVENSVKTDKNQASLGVDTLINCMKNMNNDYNKKVDLADIKEKYLNELKSARNESSKKSDQLKAFDEKLSQLTGEFRDREYVYPKLLPILDEFKNSIKK